MDFLKTTAAKNILVALIAMSLPSMAFAQQGPRPGWTPQFVIKELMPVVDPEMAGIRQMFVCMETRIRVSELVPSGPGAITKTRVAVRPEKEGSAWLTVIGTAPAYRIYQFFPRGYRVPALAPILSWAGAEHILLGTISLEGFTFESDPSFPLHFKLIQDGGYVYLCGRGTVTTPQGRQHSLGQTQTVSDFVLDLRERDQLGREAATEALGWLAKTKTEIDDAVPALIKVLKDDVTEVRRNAAEALGRIGDLRAQAALQDALQDEDEWVREVVADALKKLEEHGSE
jgi:hypothetical protein